MSTQPLTLALALAALWLALVLLLAAAPLMAKRGLNAATGWLGDALRGAGAGFGANVGREGPPARPGGWLPGRRTSTQGGATEGQMPRPWTHAAALGTGQGEGENFRAAGHQARGAEGISHAPRYHHRRLVTPHRSEGAPS